MLGLSVLRIDVRWVLNSTDVRSLFAPRLDAHSRFALRSPGRNDTIDLISDFLGMSPNAGSDEIGPCEFICSTMDPVEKLIHIAAGKDHVHTVRHFIEKYGYSPNECLRFGETVLDVARENNASRVIEYLEGIGGMEEWRLDMLDWDNESSMGYLSDDGELSDISDDALETMDQEARRYMENIVKGNTLWNEDGREAMWYDVGDALVDMYASRKPQKHDREEGCGANFGKDRPMTRSRIKRIWYKLGGRFLISKENRCRKNGTTYNDWD